MSAKAPNALSASKNGNAAAKVVVPRSTTLALEATGPPKAQRAPARLGDSIPLPVQKTNATAEGGSKKGPFHKPLPKEFRRDGFNYRQIYREGDFAIYRQTWKGNDHSAAFEVVRIKQRQGFEIGGRFIPPAEVYPRSEQWGELGWTFCNKEAAFAKLREICK
jgi:hypothetical protein